VLCACDLDTALPVKLAAWFRKKKSAFDAHEYFTEVPEVAHRQVVKSIWSAIAKLTIPRFDLCYTVGEELARIMGERYHIPFHVIRNIAPTPAIIINDNILERRKIIVYQGALNVGRGLETMLEAMVDLPEWELWLAGEGDITHELRTKTHQLNLNDRIKFLGWVIPDNLADLLLQARIHVNLREKGSLNDFYSLPNKFFDAIHAGLPSINMRYPEYEKVCKKYPCAILLESVSKDRIVEAIQLIEQQPQLLLDMETACREAAKEFNWESESQKLVSLYHNLITS
jgi:glycosyltransferase involved in cell wall biosynthesis